jgi:hypothetical protein
MEPQPDETDKQLQAFMLSNDPDVLYLWQAMKEPDWPQFKAAMQHEIDKHQKKWKLGNCAEKHDTQAPTSITSSLVYEAQTAHHCQRGVQMESTPE